MSVEFSLVELAVIEVCLACVRDNAEEIDFLKTMIQILETFHPEEKQIKSHIKKIIAKSNFSIEKVV